MELKEGMYVRTKKGNIAKIDRKVDDITNYYFGCFECDNYINVNGDEFISEYEITKASYNIIDLIEVGDILKFEYDGTEYICDVYDCYGRKDDLAVCCEGNVIHIKEDNARFDIKSIVTKKQFESMSYKVGELNETI